MTPLVVEAIEKIIEVLVSNDPIEFGAENSAERVGSVFQHLWEEPRVDRQSFVLKIEDCARNRTDLARLVDRIVEFRAADTILQCVDDEMINWGLSFGENPDLRLSINGSSNAFGVEVKHSRRRLQDAIDEERLKHAFADGDLCEYGRSPEVQSYIEEKILAAGEAQMRDSDVFEWIFFIVSDSSHQVEDVEVRTAVWHRYVQERKGPVKLVGIGLSDCGIARPKPILFTWDERDIREDTQYLLSRAFNKVAI